MITDLSQLDPNGTYTYADYLKWHFDQNVELIEGRIFNMSLAYRSVHRRMAVRLATQLMPYFEHEGSEVFAVPVRRSAAEPGL